MRVRGFVRFGISTVVAATLLTVGHTPASAAGKAVQARTTAQTLLPSGTSPTTVQSITLTSGAWTILGKAFAVDLTTAESDFFRCQLYNPTSAKQLDGSAAFVSAAFPGNMITNLAKLKVGSGVTVTIQQRCWHDHFGIAHSYLDPGATLLAFKGTTASANRLDRTTAQTTLLKTTRKTVAQIGFSQGTWVWGFKATAVNVTNRDDSVTCFLPGNTTVSQSVGTDSSSTSVATLTAFGVMSVTSATTISVSCYSNDGFASLDPNAVFWARPIPGFLSSATCGTVMPAGGAGDPPPAVADMRTNSVQCPIASGTAVSQVGGVSISPGTWVVLGAEQGMFTSLGTFVRCQAKDVGANKVIDKNATLWDSGPAFVQTSTYLGKLTTAVDTAVEFRCGTDGGSANSVKAGYVVFRP
jgi:hypothetical protein